MLETFFSLFNKRVSGEDYIYVIQIVKSINGLSMHKQAIPTLVFVNILTIILFVVIIINSSVHFFI